MSELHEVPRYEGTLHEGAEVRLAPKLTKALQFRQVNPKEAFTLCDASETFFRASLVAYEPEGPRALIYEKMVCSPESPAELTLGIAFLQRQRMLWVCQKAAELGVARIVPLFSERSATEKDLRHEKAHAWPGQAIKGSRQCRRGSVAEVSPTIAFASFLASPEWSTAERKFYLDDRAPKQSGKVELPERSDRRRCTVAFASGPEGGWTNSERAALESSGALPLRLGGRVLRAETAVLVGVTLLQYQLGDLAP